MPVPGLLSSGFAAARRGAIGDRAPDNEATFRATAGNPLPYQSDPSPSMTAASPTATTSDQEGLSTTHIVVSDRSGNVVSYTLTIESTGGSGIVVPGYGFILNHELTDFDPISPHPNSPEPGKRPRSSMAPTIAFAPDGRVLAFCSPGGSTIITTVLGIAFNIDSHPEYPHLVIGAGFSGRGFNFSTLRAQNTSGPRSRRKNRA